MKIKKITSQHRRDFQAIYECEHCGYEEESYGYDDHYFHNEVIPKMPCKECNKIAGSGYQPQATKYVEGVQV